MEYIEVFSLLAKAAEMIEDGETCVELNRYDDGLMVNVPNPRPVREERPVNNEQPKQPKSEKRKSWKRWADKLSSLMSEDDASEDDQ
jgi:hypothetical protein